MSMQAIERIKLPKPDTHCFDTDTDSDVWSYSPELVRETVLTHIDKLEKLAEERLQNCAALVAEVERLRAEVTRPESTDMTLMRALVQSQATELERLRKDAERYQWLRSEHKRYDPVCHLTWKQPCDENGSFWVNTAHLDSDIDAAMKGTP